MSTTLLDSGEESDYESPNDSIPNFPLEISDLDQNSRELIFSCLLSLEYDFNTKGPQSMKRFKECYFKNS